MLLFSLFFGVVDLVLFSVFFFLCSVVSVTLVLFCAGLAGILLSGCVFSFMTLFPSLLLNELVSNPLSVGLSSSDSPSSFACLIGDSEVVPCGVWNMVRSALLSLKYVESCLIFQTN